MSRTPKSSFVSVFKRNILPLIFLGILIVALVVFSIALIHGLTLHPDSVQPTMTSSQDHSVVSSEASKETKLVSFSGEIEHISVPLLTAFPEMTYSTQTDADRVNNYLLTSEEFRRMLLELYRGGYVLVDPTKFYEKTEDGFARIPVMFPEGKKPLILSVDDASYHKDAPKGGSQKLVIDSLGEIASSIVLPSGETEVSRQYEVFPIVEEFLRSYPDFSFDGARGIIGLTGYDGILGYEAKESGSGSTSEGSQQGAVARKLSENGWKFACNTYSRINLAKVSESTLKNDLDRFAVQVQPVIGVTDIFIFPFGSWPEHGSKKYEMLTGAGYQYFYSTGMGYYEKCYDGYVFQDRKNICGYTLSNRSDYLSKLFDCEKVLDRAGRQQRE